MRHTLQATNMRLTDPIRSYVEGKLAAIERIVDPRDTSVHADLEVGKTTKHHQHGSIFRAEINLHLAGSNLRAVAEEEDLYAAIDAMKDDIVRQLHKVKTKRTDVARRGARSAKRRTRRG